MLLEKSHHSLVKIVTVSIQLRNLAFKKLPQKSGAVPPPLSLQGLASELLQPGALSGSGDHTGGQEGWQQWKQKDEQVTHSIPPEWDPRHPTRDFIGLPYQGSLFQLSVSPSHTHTKKV